MSYRSEMASNAHYAILGYIRCHQYDDEIMQNNARVAINQLDADSMLEPSMNGYSHLMDVVRICFDNIEDWNYAKEKCTFLINLLLKKAEKLGGNVLARLLIAPMPRGFTPLHHVVATGSEQIFTIYINSVKQALKQKWVSEKQYINLLLQANNNGFTSLFSPIESNNKNLYTAFVNVLVEATNHELLSTRQLFDMLIKKNNFGVTPLLYLLKTANLLHTDHTKILISYLNLIKRIMDIRIESDKITNRDCVNLLNESDNAGFTPLDFLILLNKVEDLDIFFSMAKKLVDNKSYITLLTKPNRFGDTLLHQAANRNSISLLKYVLKILRQELTKTEYKEALFFRKGNLIPHCDRRKLNSRQINLMLNQERRLMTISNGEHDQQKRKISELELYQGDAQCNDRFFQNVSNNLNRQDFSQQGQKRHKLRNN